MISLLIKKYSDYELQLLHDLLFNCSLDINATCGKLTCHTCKQPNLCRDLLSAREYIRGEQDRRINK